MPIGLNSFFDFVYGDRAKDRKVPEHVSFSPEQQAKKASRETQVKQEKKAEFSCITNNLRLSAEFRMLLRTQNSIDLENLLYGNHTDALEESDQSLHYNMPTFDAIKSKFKTLDQEYGFFTADKNAIDLFVKLFIASKLVADYVEENNSYDNSIAYLHAYKMMVIFELESKQPFSWIDKLIGKHGGNLGKPIHDILVLPIPKHNPPLKHLNKWRMLIKQHGIPVLFLFQRAPEIESILETQVPFVFSLGAIQQAAAQILYKNHERNPELARLCVQYHMKEKDFDTCLTIKPKQSAYRN